MERVATVTRGVDCDFILRRQKEPFLEPQCGTRSHDLATDPLRLYKSLRRCVILVSKTPRSDNDLVKQPIETLDTFLLMHWLM
jgi:hypothetical protein